MRTDTVTGAVFADDEPRIIVRSNGRNTTAPTRLLHWDPAVTDPLASDRQVILFDSAGVGSVNGCPEIGATAIDTKV
jgi:hypothetical protein